MAHRITRRIAGRVARYFCSLTAFPTAHVSDRLVDLLLDRSILLFVSGFPDGSRALLLRSWLGESLAGSLVLPLVDGFPGCSRAVLLVG